MKAGKPADIPVYDFVTSARRPQVTHVQVRLVGSPELRNQRFTGSIVPLTTVLSEVFRAASPSSKPCHSMPNKHSRMMAPVLSRILSPAGCILYVGIHAYHWPQLRDLFDLNMFVDVELKYLFM